MKALFTILCLLPLTLFAQDSLVANQDTTIYDLADDLPRFPTPCENYDTTAAAKAQCSETAMLRYVNQRALYTQEAREQDISGTAVISFVVEKSGVISRARILRDPGAGLGLSALRGVASMSQDVRLIPAMKDGKPVRFRFVLPIRFRLEEPKPYVLTDRDTVYTDLTKPLQFTGHPDGLGSHFAANVTYPPSGEDSCRIGELDIQLLVDPDGFVEVQDIVDYNNLGTDFSFAAIDVATGTSGMWSPGEYEGRPVTSAYNVSVAFAPTSDKCAAVVDAYNVAIDNLNLGLSQVQDSLTVDAGLANLDLAVEAFPKDGRFRILRGRTRMDQNDLTGACEDLTIARDIALIDWFDGVLPLLCRGVE